MEHTNVYRYFIGKTVKNIKYLLTSNNKKYIIITFVDNSLNEEKLCIPFKSKL